ncbi:MAG: hypothetical protein WBA10_17825 [Elainellaceae cyanobacterium]
MTPSYDCVLVLEQPTNDLRRFEPLVERLSCRLLIAHSPEEFLNHLGQINPYLVLLVGPCQGWPADFSTQVRRLVDQFGGTVIALTEDTDEQASDAFLEQKDSMIDGCLVEPLNEEVFASILHAAKARQGMGVAC